MKAMKEKDNFKKRATYVPPRAEVIGIEPISVLCSSALMGNSTESVTTETFVFP